MRASGETYERNNHKDALASPEALPGVIKTYLGDASLDNPLVDLLHTDLTGMPAMYIATGTSDILESDAVSLAENARKAGIDVQLELPPDMQHIWIALAGNSPEADKSLSEAAAFIISKMAE
jgi:acetyl esterase/lipase